MLSPAESARTVLNRGSELGTTPLTPVLPLLGASTQVPASSLVTEVACNTALSPIATFIVLRPVLVPRSVRVRAPVWPLNPIASTPVKLITPVPEASRVPPEEPTENKRLVLPPEPV